MNYREESLKKHGEWKGKIETVCRVPVDSREALSLTYTPGVARAVFGYTKKSRAELRAYAPLEYRGGNHRRHGDFGARDIGPEAGMPVMEGKCALFKAYAGVDAFPDMS